MPPSVRALEVAVQPTPSGSSGGAKATHDEHGQDEEANRRQPTFNRAGDIAGPALPVGGGAGYVE
jgi:hypothetical protein